MNSLKRERRLKQCFRSLCLGVLAFSLLLPLAACAISSANESIKIGVINYQSNDTFINSLSASLTASFRLREEHMGKTINLNIIGAKSDQNYQNTLIDRMLQQDYDVLCINMVDRTMSAPIISKCKAANLPIVFFNREPVAEDLSSWDKLYYVGTSAVDSARLQGQMLLDLLQRDFAAVDNNKDGKIQYVMLEGEPGHQDTLYRTDYSVAVLSDAGIEMEKLDSDSANWDLTTAYNKMLSWLELYNGSIEVILANNDDMALGAIKALESKVVELGNGPYVFGIDATPVGVEAVHNGSLYGTVVNDAVGQAAAIADIALALAEGKKPSESSVLYLHGNIARIPHRPLTALNYEDEIKKLQEVH